MICGAIWRGSPTRELAPRTAARRLSALRQFYRFLVLEGVRADDPTAALDAPRLGRPLPKLLSEDEVDAAARGGARQARAGGAAPRLPRSNCSTAPACASPSWWACRSPRRAAIQRFLLVRGKGDKERLVPLGAPARAALAAYLAVRGHFLGEGESSRWLFPVARRGRPSDAARVRPAAQGTRARRRHRPGAALAACAAPRLRHAICSTTAPICAACRRCSATPTSRRRRSIRMSRATACSGSSPSITRWRGRNDRYSSREARAEGQSQP